MRIVINETLCDGCGTCVRVCPQRILVIDRNKKSTVTDEERCMGCFGCEDECPHGAVRVLRSPAGRTPEIEPCPVDVSACDVAIIGAGPAGLGAAISCARAGLDTVVFERLPNRHMSHHTDGGLLYALPWICTVKNNGDRIEFPELEISVPAAYPEQGMDMYGMIGPAGLATDNSFPPGISRGVITDKDHFVKGLIEEAEKSGAVIRFGTKVVDFVRNGEKFEGLILEDGTRIKAGAVVAADGILGLMSQKAGLPNHQGIGAYGAMLTYEFEKDRDLPWGLLYLNGGFTWEPDLPPVMAAIGIMGRIEVVFAFMMKKRFYPAEKPLDHYLEKFLSRDPRAGEILGSSLQGKKPVRLNGCRVMIRQTNRDIVRDGLVSIGDAFVAGGELGNAGALAQGVYTGRVIKDAADRNDFSRTALEPATGFISDKLDKMTTKNGQFKTLPMRLSEKEMKEFFQVMSSANYPTMLFGSRMQQTWMFTKLMLKNTFRFIRKPALLRLMMG